MSLFQALSDMSKQHAENSGESGQYHYGSILDDGKIDVVFPPVEPEPVPTVSLYNLLDHSVEHLRYLKRSLTIAQDYFDELNDKSYKPIYDCLCAWIALAETAEREVSKRDSEAWAEKTAKEITNDTL